LVNFKTYSLKFFNFGIQTNLLKWKSFNLYPKNKIKIKLKIS